MAEFWEMSFQEKETMWGHAPAESAGDALNLFQATDAREILVPGFGYGRNAAVFSENGMHVTGIEISETAIQLAEKHYGHEFHVHHGSVTEIPFDAKIYDGIYCYALIHLLDEGERLKLIQDCYHQLKPGGWMVFVAISANSPAFGEGKLLSKNRFHTRHGVNLFFYDQDAVEREFGDWGMVDAHETREPSVPIGDRSQQVFWQIACRK